MHKIICIGREFGSGGREFGRRLAEKLGYAYYDLEIINEICKGTPYSREYIEQVSEKDPIPLFPIRYGNSFSLGPDPSVSMAMDVYKAQVNTLKKMAEKSNCVIIGRAADYVLREYKPFSIFVYACLDSRIDRCLERETDKEKYSRKQMARKIKKVDKSRARFYTFATNKKWSDRNNYDLMINTSYTDIKQLVEMVSNLFK